MLHGQGPALPYRFSPSVAPRLPFVHNGASTPHEAVIRSASASPRRSLIGQVYDFTAGSKLVVPPSHFMSRAEALFHFPKLKEEVMRELGETREEAGSGVCVEHRLRRSRVG